MRSSKSQTKQLKVKEKQAIQRRTKNSIFQKLNLKNFGLSLLFFTGIILTIFEIDIFRDTIIDWEIPTCIMILAGLIFTPFMSKHLVNYYDTTALFLQLIFNIMSFGGIFVYLFMATNYYIVKDTKTESIKTKILNTGYLGKGRSGGCESPYAEVKIKKSHKQLIFSCSTEIEQYEYVDLILQEGYLGYDIILSKIPRTE